AAKSLFDGSDALRRFATVKLQNIGRNFIDDLLQCFIVCIDRQSHDPHSAARLLSKFAGFAYFEMARALRAKDKADVVGAAGNGRFQRFRRRDPADFRSCDHKTSCVTPWAYQSDGAFASVAER